MVMLRETGRSGSTARIPEKAFDDMTSDEQERELLRRAEAFDFANNR